MPLPLAAGALVRPEIARPSGLLRVLAALARAKVAILIILDSIALNEIMARRAAGNKLIPFIFITRTYTRHAAATILEVGLTDQDGLAALGGELAAVPVIRSCQRHHGHSNVWISTHLIRSAAAALWS